MIPPITTGFGRPNVFLWMWTKTIEPRKTMPTNKNSAPLVSICDHFALLLSAPHQSGADNFAKAACFHSPALPHALAIAPQSQQATKGSIVDSPEKKIRTPISSYESSGAPYKI